jgi:hypothetical protein
MWAIEATPEAVVANGMLAADACPGTNRCIAVRSSDTSAGTSALAESWNGTAWSIVAVPGASRFANSLGGVSCNPAACVAVGYYLDRADTHLALAVVSAGGGWAVQPVPSPPGAVPSILAGVSCGAASACTAVGRVYGTRSGATLAQSWNGTAWTLRPGPALPGTFGQLSGVSCTSAVVCTAVGSYRNGTGDTLPLAESWNGVTWTVQQVRAPAGGFDAELKSVSCTSPSACTAVGDYSTTGSLDLLAERWDGTAWKIQATPSADGTLYGVSCGSAATCIAVGHAFSSTAGSTTLALQWRDGTWKEQQVPFIAGILPSLYGVSCRSPRDCAAVGGVETGLDVAVTLAEAWNGSTWTVQSTPRPSSGTNSVLASVARGPGAGFTAVGSHLSSAQVSTTLAETGPG